MSRISVIATPIGNMGDISQRALDTLKSVDIILCEDTRETQKILRAYSISTPTMSYHSHSSLQKIEYILQLLDKGKNLALVSDAGTPGISDPGAELIQKIRAHSRERQESGNDPIIIDAVPGPSALSASLSIAGVQTAPSIFFGFAPHKKGRETLWATIKKEVCDNNRTCIFYESTHRLNKALNSLTQSFKDTQVTVTVVKEITKMYETVIQGSPDYVQKIFIDTPELIRGEFVVIVSPGTVA